MMIRNAEDLANVLGASDATEKSLSRRVYKGTDCGAWLALVELSRSGKPRQEKWQVRARLGVGGRIHFHARRNSKGPWLTGGTVGSIPHYVLDFLNAAPGKHYAECGVTADYRDWADFCDLVGQSPDARVQPKARVGKLGLQFILTVEGRGPSSTRPGIRVGSIVEGVDQCAESEELAFPFSEKRFRAAVQSIEDQVDEIWKSTHGCKECARLYEIDWEAPGTDSGYCPVHPDCKVCGGTGTIL